VALALQTNLFPVSHSHSTHKTDVRESSEVIELSELKKINTLLAASSRKLHCTEVILYHPGANGFFLFL